MTITQTNGHAANPFVVPPMYQRLAETIADRVHSGEWATAAGLPNERELASEYHVSGGTMRKALELLEERGILDRIQGRGTFVRPHPTWEEMAEQSAALLAVIGRFRPSTEPASKLLVAIDDDGRDLTEEGENGARVPIVRTARELRIYAEQAAGLAAWLDRRAMAAALEDAA